MTGLICYRIHDRAPEIVPARADRRWMDETNQRYAYRCLPLTIANSMGWELLAPEAFTVEWNGRPGLGDITIESKADIGFFAQSHFGHGILTLQTAHIFRTDPGYALWVRGCPNLPKDGLSPLDGVVETDWVNFSFTMNWQFTQPGRVSFDKGEPFCFITPFAYRSLDAVVPQIVPLDTAPDIKAQYEEYRRLRIDFNAALARHDPEAVRMGWQKWYFRGQNPDGEPANPQHLSKLRVAAPSKPPSPAREED
jgi:hypothetical protein